MADQPTNEQAFPLRVRVLEGPLSVSVIQDGQQPGTIRLTGRALPYRPVVFEGEQRSKLTWYPGNPKATHQVAGPVEMPTVLHGIWKDRYIGDGQARALARLFEDIRRRGPLIEVSWGEGALADDAGNTQIVGDPFTRQGILKKTKFTFEIPQRVEYELTFEWNGLDDLTSAPVTATSILRPSGALNDAGGLIDDLAATVEAFLDFQSSRVFQQAAQTVQQIHDALGAVDAVSTAISTAAINAAAVATLPYQLAGSMVATADSAREAAQDIRRAFESIVLAYAAPTDDPIPLFNLQGDILTVLGSSSDAAATCARASDNLGQAVLPDVIAEVRPSAGSDLRDLARFYYGDPDGWVDIANFNDLPSSQVPAYATGPSDRGAQTIRIPRRPAGPNQALNEGC